MSLDNDSGGQLNDLVALCSASPVALVYFAHLSHAIIKHSNEPICQDMSYAYRVIAGDHRATEATTDCQVD